MSRLTNLKWWSFQTGVTLLVENFAISALLRILIRCELLLLSFTQEFILIFHDRCGDSILINGKGNVNCPGVPFLMSLVPPALEPVLQGQNLTDKGCLPLTNTFAQTLFPHDLSAVPPGVFSGCNATNSAGSTIEVDPHNGWVSLNFISTATAQEMVVSIDDHPMWLYAVDGGYVEPQKIDVCTFNSIIFHC